jgi:hypothetical protein
MEKVGLVEALNKTETLTVRVSPLQKERLIEAARIVSAQKGETVDPMTLARDLIVQGVEVIRGAQDSSRVGVT